MHLNILTRAALALALFLQTSKSVLATDYYVSPSGNDANSGTSSINAWQTINKVNTIDFLPGDIIYFEKNATFTGRLFFNGSDNGTTINPLRISNYGTGNNPIIDAGLGDGLVCYNMAGIQIDGITVRGNGASTNNGFGIAFYTDTTVNLSGIQVANCNVTGFGNDGIILSANSTSAGFQNVLIENSNAYANGKVGISCYGNSGLKNHANVTVRNCKAYDNLGQSSETSNATGSGIVLSGINTALIEYCEAYNNGENNGNTTGGPIGIWFYLVNDGIIQYCESHHNKAGLDHDGGGFDIDGGSQNCVIQYCYSHDNEGAGYLLAEYGSGTPFTNNTVRYNISENDGRKNSYGAITIWGAGSSAQVTNSYCYNNTAYIGNNAVVNGTPAGIRLIGPEFSEVKIFNNIIYTTTGVDAVNADANTDSTQLHLLNNIYFNSSSSSNFKWSSTVYPGLSAWKSVAVSQEKRGLTEYGLENDPKLASPGSSGTIGDPTQLSSQLAGYKLLTGSPALASGLSASLVYTIDPGTTDFFGNTINPSSQNIGTYESGGVSTLPINLLNWFGQKTQTGAVLVWKLSKESSGLAFEIERSTDGFNFRKVERINFEKGKYEYQYEDKSESALLYYRLKIINDDNDFKYSNTVSLRETAGIRNNALTAINNPSSGDFYLLINYEQKEQLQITLYTSAGKQILQQSIKPTAGKQIVVLSGTSSLKHGIYRASLTNLHGKKIGLVSILH